MRSQAFLLSGEALKQLEGLAERYDVSEVDVLEYLIRVRSRTSNPHENAMRFAYTAGFNAGWNQFQTRHDLPEDAKFLKPIKEDT